MHHSPSLRKPGFYYRPCFPIVSKVLCKICRSSCCWDHGKWILQKPYRKQLQLFRITLLRSPPNITLGIYYALLFSSANLWYYDLLQALLFFSYRQISAQYIFIHHNIYYYYFYFILTGEHIKHNRRTSSSFCKWNSFH